MSSRFTIAICALAFTCSAVAPASALPKVQATRAAACRVINDPPPRCGQQYCSVQVCPSLGTRKVRWCKVWVC